MKRFILCAFLFAFLLRMAAAAMSEPPLNSHDQKVVSQTAQPTGEEVFKANCARCHTPPMSISPRITGTVIMHMRTRARLSRQDEKLLLKYMAP
jgi:cytochrome c5